MKRVFTIALTCFVLATLCGSGVPSVKTDAKQVSKSQAPYYTWYLDPDGACPTGTVSDINTELWRLRDLFSGYVFQSTFSIGMHEYEYGFYSYDFPAIIYSDMYY